MKKLKFKFEDILEMKFLSEIYEKELTIKDYFLEEIISDNSIRLNNIDSNLIQLLKNNRILMMEFEYLTEEEIVYFNEEFIPNLIKYIFYPNSFSFVIGWANDEGEIKSYKNKYKDDGFNIPLFTEDSTLLK